MSNANIVFVGKINQQEVIIVLADMVEQAENAYAYLKHKGVEIATETRSIDLTKYNTFETLKYGMLCFPKESDLFHGMRITYVQPAHNKQLSKQINFHFDAANDAFWEKR